MSTTTKNYSLIKPDLTDSADITQTNANWDVIDSELASRAKLDASGKIPAEQIPSAKSFEVIVPTTGWTTYDTMQMVAIAVSGMTAEFNPIYGLKPSGNYATEAEEETFALIKGLVTANGNVTLYASEVPTTSITLTLKGA